MDKPKFNVGDLVVYRKLLGRVTDIYKHNGIASYYYNVGDITDIMEEDITKADFRDENRILRGK